MRNSTKTNDENYFLQELAAVQNSKTSTAARPRRVARQQQPAQLHNLTVPFCKLLCVFLLFRFLLFVSVLLLFLCQYFQGTVACVQLVFIVKESFSSIKVSYPYSSSCLCIFILFFSSHSEKRHAKVESHVFVTLYCQPLLPVIDITTYFLDFFLVTLSRCFCLQYFLPSNFYRVSYLRMWHYTVQQ